MGQLYQMIKAKKQKEKLTDQGALLLIAGELGISLSGYRKQPGIFDTFPF